MNILLIIVCRGSHLIGHLGSRHSVPCIRFYRLTDVDYTIRYEFVSKTFRPDYNRQIPIKLFIHLLLLLLLLYYYYFVVVVVVVVVYRL